MDASVVSKGTPSMPISKKKELEVVKSSVKHSPNKKRKLDSFREVETEHIPMLHLDTCYVENVKLKL